jgi:hypothetical protein
MLLLSLPIQKITPVKPEAEGAVLVILIFALRVLV